MRSGPRWSCSTGLRRATTRSWPRPPPCTSVGCAYAPFPLFYDEWLGKLPLSELERVSLMFDIGEIHRARYGRLKRLLDLVVGRLGAIPMALCIPFVAVGNLFGNRGPIFYTTGRVGKNGEPFTILKFRTMRPGDRASEWTQADDPRITRFGRGCASRTSTSSPRWSTSCGATWPSSARGPSSPSTSTSSPKIPFYDLRHLVRPGLTGWAQVKYAYGASELDAMEKLQYEFFYLRHQGLSLDLRIVGRTVRSVIGRRGR